MQVFQWFSYSVGGCETGLTVYLGFLDDSAAQYTILNSICTVVEYCMVGDGTRCLWVANTWMHVHTYVSNRGVDLCKLSLHCTCTHSLNSNNNCSVLTPFKIFIYFLALRNATSTYITIWPNN